MKIALVMALGWILAVLGQLWAFVSFMIYLFKDIPFNWTSVIILVIGYLILLGQFIYRIKKGI